jgi:hypothetical protein
MDMFKRICNSCWSARLDSYNYSYALCLRCGGWKEVLVVDPEDTASSSLTIDRNPTIKMKFGPCLHIKPVRSTVAEVASAEEEVIREEIAIPTLDDLIAPDLAPIQTKPVTSDNNKKKRKAQCPLEQEAKRRKLQDAASRSQRPKASSPPPKVMMYPTKTTNTQTTWYSPGPIPPPRRPIQKVDLAQLAQHNSFKERDFVVTNRRHTSMTPLEEIHRQVEEFRLTHPPKPLGRPRKDHSRQEEEGDVDSTQEEECHSKKTRQTEKGKAKSSILPKKSHIGSFTSTCLPSAPAGQSRGKTTPYPFHVNPLSDAPDVAIQQLDANSHHEMDSSLQKMQLGHQMPSMIKVRETSISYFPQTGYGNQRVSINSEPDDEVFGRTYYSSFGSYVDCDGSGLTSID